MSEQIEMVYKEAKSLAETVKQDPLGQEQFGGETHNISTHIMTLPEGLYCIWNDELEGGTINGVFGVRILPSKSNFYNVKIGGFRQDGWLNMTNDAIFVKIDKGPGQIVIMTYQHKRFSDAKANLKVQLISKSVEPEGKQIEYTSPSPGPRNFDLIAHIQNKGDVGANFGCIVGEPGSRNYIEGFSLYSPNAIPGDEISYCVLLGESWISPPVRCGEFCGSKGLSLSLMGYKITIPPQITESYHFDYYGFFSDSSKVGPCSNGELCRSANKEAFLEAMIVNLVPLSGKDTFS